MLKWITAAACFCATMTQAQSSSLSGQQINDLVVGATVEIETPIGTKLPVRYGRDGKVSGEARGLVSYLGTAFDKGRWWVDGDRLCHKWNRWFGSEPQCLRLSKEGRIIRWRSEDGYAGTARISVPPAVHAGAVLPVPQPERPKTAPRDETTAKPPSAPEERPAAPAQDAAQPQQAAKQAPVQAAPATAPPATVPPVQAPAAASPSPPPRPRAQQAKPRRAGQPMFRVVNVRSDDVLNVRSGPSADFGIVGELPPGSRGIAITNSCRSVWCPVEHGSASGWVNSAYLAPDEPSPPVSRSVSDAPDASRTCLTAAALALLQRIERKFGPVKVISTCRPGSSMPGTALLSRHASGNAVDFVAGSRKAAIVAWLIANHRDGGTMTYAGTDHVHMDIGPHFVSIANGPRWLSWRDSRRDFPGPPQAAEK